MLEKSQRFEEKSSITDQNQQKIDRVLGSEPGVNVVAV